MFGAVDDNFSVPTEHSDVISLSDWNQEMDRQFSVVCISCECTLHTLLHMYSLDVDTAHVVVPDGEAWTT